MRHRTDNFETLKENTLAPVEHLFNNHSFWLKEIEDSMTKLMQESMKKGEFN